METASATVALILKGGVVFSGPLAYSDSLFQGVTVTIDGCLVLSPGGFSELKIKLFLIHSRCQATDVRYSFGVRPTVLEEAVDWQSVCFRSDFQALVFTHLIIR